MTTQGSLNLDCIATDPASRYLYGIASANMDPSASSDPYVVLVRSNSSPTNLSNITWTVVSSANGKELAYNYPTFTSVDCTVNDAGSFAAFVRYPYRTFSERTVVPMGSVIKGSAAYGWITDAFVHKSFFMSDGSLVHMLMGDDGERIRYGISDFTTNILQLSSMYKWDYSDKLHTQDLFYQSFWRTGDFNYTRQGFFSRDGYRNTPRLIAYRDREIYMTGLRRPSGSRAYSSYAIVNSGYGIEMDDISGVVEPPRFTFHPHYIFSGRHNKTEASFFGCLGEIQGVYKVFTTARIMGGISANHSYVEYNLTRTDTTGNYTVHEGLQTVGGLRDGQHSFAVALTFEGLYEFGIFGAEAGTMKGPFKVVVPATAGFISRPHRVALYRGSISYSNMLPS
ncbi:hypothetical protein BGX23_011882 [Mortierella sp. AD031]|nr:hypothetical protein BGX23_011882 [Mortierella sp. AD031]